MAGRPPSPALLAALEAVARGVNPHAAAIRSGISPNRVYLALARFREHDIVSWRARDALIRFNSIEMITYPICIIYRFGFGCRQYPFNTISDLQKFCNRKPYSIEILRVVPVRDRKLLPAVILPASSVVEFIENIGVL